MSDVSYFQLLDLLNLNPHNISYIKDQYLLLLSNLSTTTYIDNHLFKTNIEKISNMGAMIVGIINNHSTTFEIVACGTIIIEPKIIREGKNVGHIEDIVVAEHMQGKGLSQKILDMLRVIARENNCYKIILNCDSKVKNVYIKNGFKVKGIQMADYF